MNRELQTYYEERFSMFATQGWKDLVADVKEMQKSTDSLSGVTVDNLQFKQGELSIMRWILSLQEMSESAYEELTNAPNV